MIDVRKLEELKDQGFLTARRHPELPLTIWDYTPKAQYERMWTPETKMCRGLVLDDDGVIVARPFPKFFNLEEEDQNTIDWKDTFLVTEKMDGSLGIAFRYDKHLVFSTRGSFVSDQAIRMKDIWDRKYKEKSYLIQEGVTYLFEIVYPGNRIVVNYGDTEDLFYITTIINSSGEDLCLGQPPNGFRGVKMYREWMNKADLDKLLREQEQDENREGVVVTFPRDHQPSFRVKIKLEEYVRLHRLVTQVSNKSIWEMLSTGKPIDEILDRVPDEFYNWVKSVVNGLQNSYRIVEDMAKGELMQVTHFPTRKDQAVWLDRHCPAPYKPIVFCMLDGKDYSKHIWKMVRPEYCRPYKVDEDAV